MNLIDTHFHLDLHSNPESAVKRIELSKIYTIAVTNTPSVFAYTHGLTKNLKYVRAAVGLHPELALQREAELPLFTQYLTKTRYVGEIGLDYGNLTDIEKQRQRKIFGQILDNCAIYQDKILTIHSRGTASDVISAIGNNFPGKVIMHWFSGSLKELEKAVEYGFYFSVNTAMASSLKGNKIVSAIPMENLLTETDGPFIEVNKKPAFPTDISKTVSMISSIKQVDEATMKTLILSTFKSLLTQ